MEDASALNLGNWISRAIAQGSSGGGTGRGGRGARPAGKKGPGKG